MAVCKDVEGHAVFRGRQLEAMPGRINESAFGLRFAFHCLARDEVCSEFYRRSPGSRTHRRNTRHCSCNLYCFPVEPHSHSRDRKSFDKSLLSSASLKVAHYPAPRIARKSSRISYSHDMDNLLVLRDKVGRLREEIADIQKLNEQFRRDGWNGADAQVAHAQRNERLQAIQHELVHLADLGRKVVSTEQMKEKHRTRLHLIKQERAS